MEYSQIVQRANTLYKNIIQEKYSKFHPDLNMDEVVLEVTESTEALLEALIEEINKSISYIK